MYVHIGNPSAIEGFRDPTADQPDLLRFREVPGERVTMMNFPLGMNLRDCFNSVIVSLEHQMAKDARPAWVQSDSPGLESLLLEHWNIPASRNRRPLTWGQEIADAEVEAMAASGGGLTPLSMPLMIAQVGLLFALSRLTLRTSAGRDWMARVMGDPASTGSGSYASGSFIGVTANATAPSVSNTTLLGEIATGSLIRAQAVYSHTNGTSPYTLTKPFVSDQTVTLNKLGVFTAVTGGTMIFESLLNAPSTVTPGDTTNVTETVTLV